MKKSSRMILPTKHLSAERALLTVGSELLAHLRHPRTVSALWDMSRINSKHISYDWFVLSLDFLFMIGAVRLDGGVVAKAEA